MDFDIADLFELVADVRRADTAVVDGHRRLTYRELDEVSARFAAALGDAGLVPGDRVGVLAGDRVEHVVALLGAFKHRAIPVNLNWRYTAGELAYVLSDASVRALVYESSFDATVAGALADLGPDVARFAIGPSGLDAADFGVATGPATAAAERRVDRSGDDLYVLYTGGTTGLPKGVVWRQEDIFFAVLGGGNPGGRPIEHPEEIRRTVVANPALRLAPFLGDDPAPTQFVQLALGPLMHASGQWSALGTLLGGGRVVLVSRRPIDMTHVLDLVEEEGVVGLNIVGDTSGGPLLEALGTRHRPRDTSSLRLIGSGGTTLSATTKQRLLDAFPTVVAITEAIGSSEAPAQGVSVVTRGGESPPTLSFAAKADTVVLDDALARVEPGSGVVGHLATTGRIPLGYLGDPAQTRRTFVEVDGRRWVLPGDMATVAADGSIRVLGRGSLCINTGGEKVYPDEVEAVLRSHAGVDDAIVVGVPDERFGEAVTAVVACRAAAAPTDEELRSHVRGLLAGYKVPRSFVRVPAVVRTAAGKPDYAWARSLAERDTR